jgi:hypothetical protein
LTVGDVVLTEAQDHGFLGRIDDVKPGHRPGTRQDHGDYPRADQAAAGEAETATTTTATSATEDAAEARLQLFQYFIEIGGALLTASVAPGIASAVTAGFVPRH